MILYTKEQWEEIQKERKVEKERYENELNDLITHLNDRVDDKGSGWVSTGVFPKKTQP